MKGLGEENCRRAWGMGEDVYERATAAGRGREARIPPARRDL
jgi:hypothetical protein